ncbi:metallophosphoesterase family protein [Sphingomonas sp. 8AM]|uniref:metallophosphoesterase family protein n=1 Tax=Sphingomonas sp. 8AM TaxID=2653170 RepID=UPI00135A09ED|nr:metallophosphoesterase family protein [Sphingomonas sp. 8AM]
MIERIYAIGDVHGRLDLFAKLIARIGRDHEGRSPGAARIILLGDIIDRGADGAAMVKGCMKLTTASDHFMVLKGNHEEMMVQALAGDLKTYRAWLEFGGRETLLGWGVDTAAVTADATRADLRRAAKTVGPEVLTWLDQLPLYHQHDGFMFVHAGIRPAIPLRQQDPGDMLWITDDFLESELDHGKIVVHGHSIVDGGPDLRPNRIGIDTGAFRTNRLTAIRIEQGDVWFADTGGVDDFLPLLTDNYSAQLR